MTSISFIKWLILCSVVSNSYSYVSNVIANENYIYGLHTKECLNAFNQNANELKIKSRESPKYTSIHLSEKVPYIFEDFCNTSSNYNVGNRGSSMWRPHFMANEVTIDHQYKFVYLANRKCANTEINDIIQTHFEETRGFGGCTCDRFCTLRRCSTNHLKKDVLENYFFFTFVRNPWTRYFSSYKQAFFHKPAWRNAAYARKQIENTNKTYIVGNEHFLTQSFVAFSPVEDGLDHVPMHYVGKLENFNHDLNEVFALISKHANKELPNSLNIFLNNLLTGNIKKPHKNMSNEQQLLELAAMKKDFPLDLYDMIGLIYKQDFLCFNYSMSRY